MDDRITQLEIYVGHLEGTVMSLDEALRDQQKQLNALTKKMERIQGQVKGIGSTDEADGAPEPPPPHYLDRH